MTTGQQLSALSNLVGVSAAQHLSAISSTGLTAGQRLVSFSGIVSATAIAHLLSGSWFDVDLGVATEWAAASTPPASWSAPIVPVGPDWSSGIVAPDLGWSVASTDSGGDWSASSAPALIAWTPAQQSPGDWAASENVLTDWSAADAASSPSWGVVTI